MLPRFLKRPQRLPVVLTRHEVRGVLDRLDGVPRLMACLLYDAGLRVLECCRLRIQDVDFAANQLIVRGGKGDKDRVPALSAGGPSLPRSQMAPQDHSQRGPAIRQAWQRALGWLVVALLSLFLAALLIVALLAYGAYALSLHLLLWLVWSPAGKRVLLVYSNSPIWQSYFEEQILPRLPSGSVVLNWSERRHWRRWSLAHLVFRFFGGHREFNPVAVVIRPLRWGKTFRFWQAFRDFKHGRRESLIRVEADFFRALGVREDDAATKPAA
jgi:hypothetical protein